MPIDFEIHFEFDDHKGRKEFENHLPVVATETAFNSITTSIFGNRVAPNSNCTALIFQIHLLRSAQLHYHMSNFCSKMG